MKKRLIIGLAVLIAAGVCYAGITAKWYPVITPDISGTGWTEALAARTTITKANGDVVPCKYRRVIVTNCDPSNVISICVGNAAPTTDTLSLPLAAGTPAGGVLDDEFFQAVYAKNTTGTATVSTLRIQEIYE